MARIALIGENSVSFIEELIKIWNSGNCAVLIDWRTPAKTAIDMMVEANVCECRIEKEIYNKFSVNDYANLAFVTYERNPIAELLPEDIYNAFNANYSANEAVIIYSSGTTGRAKGIILSHYALNTNADSIIDYMNPQPNDAIYIVKSLSHSSTLTGELLVALKTKIKLLISPTIVPPRYVLNNVSKYNITILCVNPTLLSIYAIDYQKHNYQLSSLRVIYVSGSILNDNIYNLANKVFSDIAVYNVYGLSEAGPRVTAQQSGCCKGNSVGKPIMNVELIIVNEKGEIVKKGERGIIHVNTPCRFIGYVTGNEKNESLYKDWLNTGDIGYIDESNELHIVDRIDDVIILNSHKIYPGDIERVIINNTDVTECVVVKVKTNNNVFIGCLYTGSLHDEYKMKEKLINVLLPYEVPRRFVYGKTIPRSKNGKILKSEVIKFIEKLL